MEMLGLVVLMIVLYALAGAALLGIDTQRSNHPGRHPRA